MTARLHLAYGGLRHAFTTRNGHVPDASVIDGAGRRPVLGARRHLALPADRRRPAARRPAPAASSSTCATRSPAARSRRAQPGVRQRGQHLRRFVRAARRAGLWCALSRRPTLGRGRPRRRRRTRSSGCGCCCRPAPRRGRCAARQRSGRSAGHRGHRPHCPVGRLGPRLRSTARCSRARRPLRALPAAAGRPEGGAAPALPARRPEAADDRRVDGGWADASGRSAAVGGDHLARRARRHLGARPRRRASPVRPCALMLTMRWPLSSAPAARGRAGSSRRAAAAASSARPWPWPLASCSARACGGPPVRGRPPAGRQAAALAADAAGAQRARSAARRDGRALQHVLVGHLARRRQVADVRSGRGCRFHFHCAWRRGDQQASISTRRDQGRRDEAGKALRKRGSVAVGCARSVASGCPVRALAARSVRIIGFCVWSLSHAPSRQSAHLRRCVVGARLLPGVAPRHQPGDPPVAQHHAEPAAGLGGDGHRHRGAPGDRHRAGRRHRHRAQEPHARAQQAAEVARVKRYESGAAARPDHRLARHCRCAR